MTRRAWLALALASTTACRRVIPDDPELHSRGSVELTAQLIEIPAPFPSNDLYNYAYVLRYRVTTVHRGKVDGSEILVAHYNPLKPRAAAQDEFSGKLGGHLERFRAGDRHRMALEAPVDQFWMGGIVDKYFERPGTRFWAVWTNLET